MAANSDAMISAIGTRRAGAPRLRLVPRLRHPVHRRLGQEAAQGEGVVRLRRRVRSRRLSDPRASATRRRAATATSCWSTRTPAASTSCSTRAGAATAGRPARAPSGICAPTTCAPTAGRRADAAGLPILPGLVRYDEVAAGRDPPRAALHRRAHAHAPTSIPRATTPATPARRLPPMGLRVRLKASVDISGYGKQARVVAAGAQDLRDDPGRQRQHWFISGASDQHYDDDDLHASARSPGRGLRGRRHLGPAQRVRRRGRGSPDRGTPGAPGESTMRTWATSRSLRPPCSSPSSFCLTYYLCVGPRRAIALMLAGGVPLIADRDVARHGRVGRRLRTVVHGPSGRRAGGLVPGARLDRSPSPPAPPSAPGATTSSGGHEVSSNRRAARRLRRRESHQAPPARSTNGPATMAAKSAPRPATEITPSASSAVRSNAPGLRRRRDRRAAPGDEIEREAGERGALLASRGRRGARSRAQLCESARRLSSVTRSTAVSDGESSLALSRSMRWRRARARLLSWSRPAWRSRICTCCAVIVPSAEKRAQRLLRAADRDAQVDHARCRCRRWACRSRPSRRRRRASARCRARSASSARARRRCRPRAAARRRSPVRADRRGAAQWTTTCRSCSGAPAPGASPCPTTTPVRLLVRVRRRRELPPPGRRPRRLTSLTGGDVRVCVATTPTITADDGGEAEHGREAQRGRRRRRPGRRRGAGAASAGAVVSERTRSRSSAGGEISPTVSSSSSAPMRRSRPSAPASPRSSASSRSGAIGSDVLMGLHLRGQPRERARESRRARGRRDSEQSRGLAGIELEQDAQGDDLAVGGAQPGEARLERGRVAVAQAGGVFRVAPGLARSPRAARALRGGARHAGDRAHTSGRSRAASCAGPRGAGRSGRAASTRARTRRP